MEKQKYVDFDPWLLSPQPKKARNSKPKSIISLGVPDDGLPAIRDELRWVSRGNKRCPVQVIRTGFSEWCPGTSVKRKKSFECSIQLVVSGKGTLEVNGKKFDLEVNDVFILHDGEEHVYCALPPERFHRKVAFLGQLPSTNVLKQTGLDKVSHVRLSHAKAEYFRDKLEHIDLVNRSKQDGFTHIISSEVYELILILSEQVYHQIDSPELPVGLIKSMEFVLDNINVDLQCEMIAEAAHCSTGHITKLYNRYLNTTPHHWMERQKIRYAAELLQTSRKKVFEISDFLGYCDQFHFAKVFRRVIGMSPTRYRRCWRNKSVSSV